MAWHTRQILVGQVVVESEPLAQVIKWTKCRRLEGNRATQRAGCPIAGQPPRSILRELRHQCHDIGSGVCSSISHPADASPNLTLSLLRSRFADNAPDADAKKSGVDQSLAGMLGDLSPETNGLALRALKLWATKDSLPQVVAFARRLEKAGDAKGVPANKSAMIDVLAQFPDATAAEAIALELKDPAQRGKAAQALVKLGSVASGPVLAYINHPDDGVRKEAASLCRLLKIPADRQLDQTLADVGSTSKARSRTALERLAGLRADDANRAKVSKALNAPLLDTDAGIRDAALDALNV